MELNIPLSDGQRLYFASDFHLGWPDDERSRVREHKIIRWLEMVEQDAAHVFLVGDIFDFWYEYRHVVPKGFVRFLGKLAEMTDSGIAVSVFGGNHDMWMYDYLPSEIGVKVYPDLLTIKSGEHSILVGHGDGLGPGDHAYKLIKIVFRNPICRVLFSGLHPWFGVGLAHYWSRSRKKELADRLDKSWDLGSFRPERERLLSYCKAQEQIAHHDFYVFGHRHLAMDIAVNDRSRYINLGHWFGQGCTYGMYDGKSLQLKGFEQDGPLVFPQT